MGAEELARYFPDRTLALFVATWNMQGQKVSGRPRVSGCGRGSCLFLLASEPHPGCLLPGPPPLRFSD